MARYSEKKILGLIFFLGVGLSLVYSFYYKIPPVVDAQAYDKIAQNLVGGLGFREEATGPILFDASIVRAGPGYEYFLAALYFIFGHHYSVVWVVQAILHGLTALLVYYASRALFNQNQNNSAIGLWAALIVAVHPDLIEISAMLMTETLYLFFTAAIIYCFIKLYENPVSYFWLILLGLVSSLGVLTRPPLLLIVPVVILMLYWARSLRSVIWYLVFFILPIIPWVVRNWLVYHQFIPTTLIGEYNLWVGNTLLSNGGQISGGFNALAEYTAVNGFGGLSHQAHAVFFAFLTHHFGFFINLCFLRFIRYFSLIRPLGFWFYQTGLKQTIFIATSGVAIALLFVFGFTGMILAWRERSARVNYLVVLTLTAPLLLLATVVESRYRFQIYPFLAIFAGYAINYLWGKKLWYKQSALVAVLVFFAIISSTDIFLNSSLVLERILKLIKL